MKRRNFFAITLGFIAALFVGKPSLISRWESGEIFYVMDMGEDSFIQLCPSFDLTKREKITQKEARVLLEKGEPVAQLCTGKVVGVANPNHPYIRLSKEMALAA